MSETPPAEAETDIRTVSADVVAGLLKDRYGLSGEISRIAGRRQPHFLIDNGHMRYLLKIAPADGNEPDIAGEHALMRHITRSPDGPRVPEPVAPKEGPDVFQLPLDGAEWQIRLLTYLDGLPPPAEGAFSEEAVAAFGTISAALAKSLENFEHPMLEREPELDLRRAGPLAIELLSTAKDHQARDLIARIMVANLKRVQALAPKLRTQVSHQNLTGVAVIGETRDGAWIPDGVTDFTGLANGWLVAGLANTCAFLLRRNDGDPFSILPTIHAYHTVYPLTEAELDVLWPLIMIRAALIAALAEHQRAEDPENDEIAKEADERRRLLDKLADMAPALANAAILDACGVEKPIPALARLLPDIDPGAIRLVDLGPTSPHFREGNWADPEIDWKLLAQVAWETGLGATRYGEYRLSRSEADATAEPENFALHIDICLPAGTAAFAPFSGRLKETGPRLVFSCPNLTLHVEGLVTESEAGAELAAGDALGVVAGEDGSVGGLRLRLCRDADLTPPMFSTPEKAGLWRLLCPSPSPLIGLDADVPIPLAPARFVRGWREHLFDACGRDFLDFSGAAGLIGHGRPELAGAAQRQLLLLDIAPGEMSGPEEEFRARMAALLPAALDTLFLAENRKAANGLASRLKGDREHLVIADETETGYHRRGQGTWAFEEDGPVPDILIADDPAGTGFAIVCARNDLAEEAGDESAHHPPVSAARLAMANAALVLLEKDNLRENALQTGAYLKTALEELAGRFPVLAYVHGNGLDLSIQLEGDRETLLENLRSARILPADLQADRLPLRPPLCLSEKNARLFIDRLERALSKS